MKRTLLAAVVVVMPYVACGAIKTEPIPALRPPRTELPPAPERRSALPWVIGGAGLVLVALALLWPRRKAVEPPPSPYAAARATITGLREDPALATPAAISAILRRFAVSAFGLTAAGLTSEEVASGLATRRNCPVELASDVWQLLLKCDVAKFAPGESGAGSAELLAQAEKLVDSLEAARSVAERTL